MEQVGFPDLSLDALEIGIGFLAGFLTRLWLLRSDYRQYPSYPHSYIIHVALGAMAALVGSVLFPALSEGDYAAVTFLLLVATQFRDIRKIERESLMNIEGEQLVPRGAEYIEGIARVFEARNYLAMIVSIVSAGTVHLFGAVPGVVAGAACLLVAASWRSGLTIEDIAEVELAPVQIRGSDLYVGDIYIMNIGLPEIKQQVVQWAVGIIIRGTRPVHVMTLGSVGQRNAIIHDLVDRFGMRKDIATPEFTPLARKNQENGDLAIYFTPMIRDEQAILRYVKRVPVLETSHLVPKSRSR